MKRIILLIFLLSTLAFSQYTNWEDKTAEQLSGITSGVTNIASKSYWTSNAYAQLKVLFDVVGDMAIEATDTTALKAMPVDTSLYIAFLNQDATSLNGWYFKIDSANAENGDNDYFDCAETGKQWKRYIGIPFPSTNLSADSIVVMADSGLGGGGVVNLGDTVRVRAHVDTLSVGIENDTLHAWRAFSRSHFPDYPNMVPWDFTLTDTDSVFLCTWVDTTTNSWRNYFQVQADTNSTTRQEIYLVFEFEAPRNVSSVTDTFITIEFQTSSADSDSTAIQPFIYENSTQRFAADSAIVSNDTWAETIILADSVSNVVAGDRFLLIIRVIAQYGSTTNPSTWLGRIRERWY
jgi:hypothetical protein